MSAKELGDKLGVQTRGEQQKLAKTLCEMRREGELESQKLKGLTTYRLKEVRKSKQEKIWRALALVTQKGEALTPREAAVLAGTSLDYAKRYLKWLVSQGVIGRAEGKKPDYRLFMGQEQLPAPRWHRRAEESILPAAVVVVGIESVGVSKDALQKAAGLFGEMAEALGRAAANLEEAQEIEAELAVLWMEVGHGKSTDQA